MSTYPVLLAISAVLALAAIGAAPALAERPPKLGSCTMAVSPTRTTVEVQIANAADFCELVSQAIATNVFRAPVIVIPGRLWHFLDAALSCRLRYGDTRYRMTIRNSGAACSWFIRLASDWHFEAATSRMAS